MENKPIQLGDDPDLTVLQGLLKLPLYKT